MRNWKKKKKKKQKKQNKTKEIKTKKLVNNILHIGSIFRLQWVHVAPTLMQFYADGLPLKSYGWSVFICLFLPVTQAVSIPFCTTLELQLSLYRNFYHNGRAHCPLLHRLRTSDILAGVHSYFCHDLFPNLHIYIYIYIYITHKRARNVH